MTITLHVGSDLFEHDLDPYVTMWAAIIYYLDDLEDKFCVKKLAGCDPYGEVVFNLEYCKLLSKEIPNLFRLFKERKLPDPSCISRFSQRFNSNSWWDCYGDLDILTWEEIEKFLIDLRLIITKAVKENRPIIAVGD